MCGSLQDSVYELHQILCNTNRGFLMLLSLKRSPEDALTQSLCLLCHVRLFFSNSDHFYFLGFLSKNNSKRDAWIIQQPASPFPHIPWLFKTPGRPSGTAEEIRNWQTSSISECHQCDAGKERKSSLTRPCHEYVMWKTAGNCIFVHVCALTTLSACVNLSACGRARHMCVFLLNTCVSLRWSVF